MVVTILIIKLPTTIIKVVTEVEKKKTITQLTMIILMAKL